MSRDYTPGSNLIDRIYNYKPLEGPDLTAEEIADLLEKANRRMDELGFTEANKRTEELDRPTSEDYAVTITRCDQKLIFLKAVSLSGICQ